MSHIIIKMLVTVEFDPAHQLADHLARDMQKVIEQGMGNGAFTSGTDATVESWTTEIVETKEVATSISLYRLLETAHTIVCNGYEIDSQIIEMDIKRIDCGDDTIAFMMDQEVELADDGTLTAQDLEGNDLEFEFGFYKPLTMKDIPSAEY